MTANIAINGLTNVITYQNALGAHTGMVDYLSPDMHGINNPSRWHLYGSTEENEFAFPQYTNKAYCHTNSASAALNKWLKPRVPEKCVIHSFRHSMRDRLRAINAPSEMIDQIGGWSNQSIGKNYGSGYTLKNLLEAMNKISDD